MSNRDRFTFFRSYWESIKLLPPDGRIALMEAICQCQFLEARPEDITFDHPMLAMAWTNIMPIVSQSIDGFLSKTGQKHPLGKGGAEGGADTLGKGGADTLGKGGAEGGADTPTKHKEKEKDKEKDRTTPSKERKDSPTSTVDSTSRDFPSSPPQPPASDQDAPPPPDDSYFYQDDADSYIDPGTGEEIPFPGLAS